VAQSNRNQSPDTLNSSKVDPELDESFKRIFDPNFVKKACKNKDRISKDILLDNYFFKRKRKKESDKNERIISQQLLHI